MKVTYDKLIADTALELHITKDKLQKIMSAYFGELANILQDLPEEEVYIPGFCKFKLNNKKLNKMFRYDSKKGAIYIKQVNQYKDYNDWNRFEKNTLINEYLKNVENTYGPLNKTTFNNLKSK